MRASASAPRPEGAARVWRRSRHFRDDLPPRPAPASTTGSRACRSARGITSQEAMWLVSASATSGSTSRRRGRQQQDRVLMLQSVSVLLYADRTGDAPEQGRRFPGVLEALVHLESERPFAPSDRAGRSHRSSTALETHPDQVAATGPDKRLRISSARRAPLGLRDLVVRSPACVRKVRIDRSCAW